LHQRALKGQSACWCGVRRMERGVDTYLHGVFLQFATPQLVSHHVAPLLVLPVLHASGE
jgi:hypothetical protein